MLEFAYVLWAASLTHLKGILINFLQVYLVCCIYTYGTLFKIKFWIKYFSNLLTAKGCKHIRQDMNLFHLWKRMTDWKLQKIDIFENV